MRLTFIGATRCVTGSSFLLEVNGHKLLVDCGLYQGSHTLEVRNRAPFPYAPAAIDEMVLTHAHIDHSGLIPRLVKEGYKGTIFAHPATADLAGVMLADSGHIQEMEAKTDAKKRLRRGLSAVEPLYTVEDARAAAKHFKAVPYHEPISVLGGLGRLTLIDAGHILGSSVAQLDVTENGSTTRMVFSGDLGNSPTPVLRPSESPEAADVVLMESTYGNRLHEDRENREEKLAEAVRWAAERKGKVIIPAFAVGRTQEIIYALSAMFRSKTIPKIPVFIDSPLAREATEVFRRHQECWDEKMQARMKAGDDPFHFEGLTLIESAQESMALNARTGPAVIISSSGMCNAGRILHHLKHSLWSPDNVVLIVGYQGEGSLGRQLVEGAKTVRIFGESVAVHARIVKIGGFSAHADADGLLRWIKRFKTSPKNVFVIHGEEPAAVALSERIGDEVKVKATVPWPLEVYDVSQERVALVHALEHPAIPAAVIDELVGDLDHLLDHGVARLGELRLRLDALPAADQRARASQARRAIEQQYKRLGEALAQVSPA